MKKGRKKWMMQRMASTFDSQGHFTHTNALSQTTHLFRERQRSLTFAS